MLHQMVAIFDIKCGAYARPVAVPADGAAIRMVQDAVNDSTTEYSKHPEDYSLWNVGTYDDSTGKLTSSTPVQLAQCVSLKNASV